MPVPGTYLALLACSIDSLVQGTGVQVVAELPAPPVWKRYLLAVPRWALTDLECIGNFSKGACQDST